MSSWTRRKSMNTYNSTYSTPVPMDWSAHYDPTQPRTSTMILAHLQPRRISHPNPSRLLFLTWTLLPRHQFPHNPLLNSSLRTRASKVSSPTSYKQQLRLPLLWYKSHLDHPPHLPPPLLQLRAPTFPPVKNATLRQHPHHNKPKTPFATRDLLLQTTFSHSHPHPNLHANHVQPTHLPLPYLSHPLPLPRIY